MVKNRLMRTRLIFITGSCKVMSIFKTETFFRTGPFGRIKRTKSKHAQPFCFNSWLHINPLVQTSADFNEPRLNLHWSTEIRSRIPATWLATETLSRLCDELVQWKVVRLSLQRKSFQLFSGKNAFDWVKKIYSSKCSLNFKLRCGSEPNRWCTTSSDWESD